MNGSSDSVRLIEQWLGDGPDVAPDRVLAEVVDRLGSTRQERGILLNRFSRGGTFALATLAVAVLIGIAYVVSRNENMNVGPPPTASPAASAFGDSDVLAFVRDGDLWVAPEDGSGAHQITTGGQVGAPAWSPDGNRLAYDQRGVLYVMELDGTVRRVTDSAGPFCCPSWSPDGERLVVVAPDGFAIVGLDGSIQQLSQPSVGLCLADPEWGPTGLIVFTGNASCSTGAEPTSLYTISSDGSGLRNLYGHGSQVFSASWSPDGRRIAFQDNAEGGCIFVVEADGTNVRRVWPGCSKGLKITWSPDGTRIAWAGASHGPEPAFVIDADGTNVRVIDGLSSVSYLDWRPAH